MNAAVYRFRAELRRRRLAWIGIGVVVGLAAGAVLALLAGARRTDSAYDRFLAAHDAADVQLVSGVEGLFGFAQLDLDAIERRPDVVESARLRVLPVVGRTPDGRIVSAEDLNFAADPDGRYGTEVDRFKLLDGRRADPTDPDEVVVNFPAADRFGLAVGDVLTVDFLEEEEFEALFADGRSLSEVADRADEELEIVGVVAVPGTFPPAVDPTGDLEFAYLTPARSAVEAGGLAVDALSLVLAGGADAVGPFLAELQAGSGDLPVAGTSTDADADGVRRALGALERALLIGAALAAVVTVLVLGQVLTRQASDEAGDDARLGALGFAGRERRQLRSLKALVVGAVAASMAVATAVALSPLFPIGLARTAEPDPGLDVDGVVLAAGAVAVLLATLAVAGLADRATRLRATNRARGIVARRLEDTARGPVALAGTTLATSQRGVVGTVAGIALGLLTVLGILTFVDSLDRLRSRPPLYGWTWDVTVGGDFGQPLFEDGVDEVARDPAVLGLEVGAFVDVELAGSPAGALALRPVRGDIAPALVEGRAGQGSDEVVLAPGFARDVDVGDRVPLSLGDRTVEVEVVGRAAMPDADLVADFDAARELSPDVAPQLVVVELEPGTDVEAFAARAIGALGLQPSNFRTPELPQDLANFGRADATPAVIAGLMAFVAMATLFHALVTALQRGRRTLAILRTVGFTARQLLASVAWQSALLVASALVAALPLGVVAGRLGWLAFAEELGVVAEPSVPVPALAATSAVALVAAVLVGVLPGWRAGRVAPVGALRAD